MKDLELHIAATNQGLTLPFRAAHSPWDYQRKSAVTTYLTLYTRAREIAKDAFKHFKDKCLVFVFTVLVKSHCCCNQLSFIISELLMPR